MPRGCILRLEFTDYEGSVSIQTPKYDFGEPVSWFSAQKDRLCLLPSFPGCDSPLPA